jgi:hypothetical protein
MTKRLEKDKIYIKFNIYVERRSGRKNKHDHFALNFISYSYVIALIHLIQKIISASKF